jgi:NAD(P)-dependent dehydrogenase (short-subunit alcohol dehydrogenase family)
MSDRKIWIITGAGRGMGVDIAQAALAAGHAVAATGRNIDAVAAAVGESDDLLVVELDITSLASVEAAVEATLERFGRIDVLVNNAGNFYAGFFEELTPEQIERQIATNLTGPMNVARAVLPVMREQRSGHVVSISSTAGIVGQEFCSAYAASKFGLEGWMESLRFEIEPFGIHTTIVEPGFFRTELLTKESTAYADLSVDDYAERTAHTRPAWEAMSGKQTNDPA